VFQLDKPMPAVNEDSTPYWEGTRQGELRAQCCSDCGHLRFPPALVCPKCLGESATWQRLSGRGTIYTFIVVHRPQHPAFLADAPYNVAIIELEEGVRMHTNIVDCSDEDLHIGMPVEAVFEKINDDVTLPRFRPAR
jgi:uncharacterized OB-fold protein